MSPSAAVKSTVEHGIKAMAVLGTGQMGLGIAYVSSLRARIPRVFLSDPNPSALEKGLAFFDALLEKDVKKGKISAEDAQSARKSIMSVGGIEEGWVKECELVIEATPESLDLKTSIFRSLATHARSDAILATNTSSISITKIAAAAVPEGADAQAKASRRVEPAILSPTSIAKQAEGVFTPTRVVGLHYFNPVPVSPLVELISALQTSDEVLARARAFAEASGKTVTESKDTPGFISNRVLMPMINEAIMCLENGIATRDDIDTTMKLGMAHPMGPLQLADFIGLDTCLSIMNVLYTETRDSKYRASVLLGRMVDAGYLGKKTGKGFYEYPAK